MITFLGDVALISEALESDYKPSYPYVFNFEYVFGDKERFKPIPNKINLCSQNCDYERIFGKNPIAVSIANNHIYDYGEDGVSSTIDKIVEENIGLVGKEPYYIDDTICLLSYVALESVNSFSFDYNKVEKTIKDIKLKNNKTKIIVQMHWGIENHPLQNSKQTEIGHWLIDKGVDLIIGHHPHCIQPIEEYNGKYICYSLGNGLFANIDQPSHFDENGKAKREYRFKWQKWNRTSLAINYDENNGKISVSELYQQKNKLCCKKENVEIGKYCKKYNSSIARLIYVIRKYYLFFISNSFVNGKIFDLNALKCELKK